jgi:ligand-binding SRPBCC domain-containing protein
MAAHSIKSVQKMPVSLEQAWSFYSKPANLNMITPLHMKFQVISKHHGEDLYQGQIFEYKLRPLFGIPVYWMTEITHVNAPKYFADEQRKGPYAFWQHQHHFKSIEGGVEMTDIVHYKNPLGFVGNIANSFFVRKKLREIFEFRFRKNEEIFGRWPGQQPSISMH